MLAAVAVVSLLLGPSPAPAAPGDLDRGFNGDGIATLGADTRLFDAAVQGDGKLIATGVQGAGAGQARLLVARFTTAGGLDPAFSGDGVFLGSPGTTGRAVVVDAGKIVVAGSLTNPSGQFPRGMLVMRLRPNGAPDVSFSGDGLATALTEQRGQVLAVALAGGDVLAAGSATLPGGTADGFDRVAVARFNPNGSADQTFGVGGSAVLDFGRLSFANAVAVQPNGRIVIGGSQRHNLQNTAVLAARLTGSGRPDGSFGGNAGLPGLFVQQYAQGAAYSAAFDLALLPGGKIVLGGAATNGVSPTSGADAIAVQLRANGVPDPAFGGDGAVYLPATSNRDQFTHDVPFPGAQGLTLAGNDIVLGGYFDNLGIKQAGAWALNRSGSLDQAFGSGGRVITQIGDPRNSSAQLADVVTSPNGDIYGVGDVTALGDASSGLAVRYLGLGPPPGGPSPSAPKCFGKTATIVGTARSERLVGTPGRDIIVGFGGRDRIIGGDGTDLICGYKGNDSIASGGGRDLVSGGPGNDTLVTKRGPDRVFGNAGNDRIFLGPQRDRAFGNAGADRIFGSDGPDVLYGNVGPDVLFGNRGDDKLFGNRGNDRLLGNRGTDLLNGDGGSDQIRQ